MQQGPSNVLTFPGVARRNPDRANGLPPGTQRSLTLSELWKAIAGGRVVNHYQPQYDLVDGRIVAVEALARIVDRDGQLLLPNRFIVQAEHSGMILPLGRAVIRQACADLASWRRQGHDLDRVAINLSAHQLNGDELLVGFIQRMVEVHGLNHEDLELEITERHALTSGSPARNALHTLAATGMRLALDDFGVGYSSVACLTELDVRTVKLDRSMVNRLPQDRALQRIVRHLLAMARELDLEIVAQGIETDEQQMYHAQAGCGLGQGYLVARPMGESAISDFLRA